jgi:hypothetical protein
MEEHKLEEIVDMLAEYGGLNREYLRDKILTFVNDGRSETKNKMAEVAAMFGKKLNEPFYLKDHKSVVLPYVFTESGMYFLNHGEKDINDHYRLLKLLIGNAEIVEGE